MCSISLVRLGHNVTILECSPTPLLHNQGAGIVAGGETQAFFSKHDCSKRPIGVTSRKRIYLNQRGDLIDVEDLEQRMTSWDLLYYLGRANFDGVKSEYLPEGTPLRQHAGEGRAEYRYGCKVTDVKEVDGKLEITFENTQYLEGQEHSQSEEERDPKSGTLQADLLIAADGASSILRRLLIPRASNRTYAGYVAFRGTVPEASLSDAARQALVEKFTFFHAPAVQILAYTIPGHAGALEKGKRLVNWVWYCNYDESSSEYVELMTDVGGVRHHFTLPPGGKMKPDVWERQKERAKKTLPPQFAEVVAKTTTPFAQAITDLSPPEMGTRVGRLMNGKAILVGDALSEFRPHTAASTSQAAFHALLLEAVFEAKLTWDQYEAQVLQFAKAWFERGVMLGTRSQFGHHPLAGNE